MKKISPDILEKYVAGKCSPEERRLVDEWFSQQEDEQEDPRLYDPIERADLDKKMLAKIRATVREDSDAHGNSIRQNNRPRKSIMRTMYRAAIGFAAVLIVGFSVYFFNTPKVFDQHANVELTEVMNPTSSITRHELQDGTSIWLHPRSRIKFPPSFEKNKRTVELVGEAFFEVAKDLNRPFIITTGKVTTQVLGTSFNIKAYAQDASIEVSVLTGKVAVHLTEPQNKIDTASTTVLLTPNERVTYLKEKNTLEKEVPKDLPELSMWQATSVVFDNVSVKDVLTTLNNKFGARIEVRNENLLNCLIKADFTHQNLPDILELLSKSVEATYELENDTIYLSGEGCVN